MTERHDLTIRPYGEDDIDALHDAVRSSVVTLSKWLPWCHADYSREDARAWVLHCIASWERGAEFPMGIFGSDGSLLGGVGLNRIDRDNGVANLGYWVRDSAQGQGVATQAARLMAQLAVAELGFRRLEIVVLPDNRASQKVAEKLGARNQGLFPGRLIHHSQPVTAIVYYFDHLDKNT